MQIKIYLILAAALVGIGIGSALSKRNMISLIMAITTAGTGALIAMATLGYENEKQNDGLLFALVLGASLLILIVMGCALAYRRFMSNGTTNIGDGNQLRH